MPVFTRSKEDVVVLTADGDYTTGELQRVGDRALAREEGAAAGPLLLDLSGAAGLDGKAASDLVETGEAIGRHRERVSRLAVVVAAQFAPLFDSGSAFARAAGVETRACASHVDAMIWLRG